MSDPSIPPCSDNGHLSLARQESCIVLVLNTCQDMRIDRPLFDDKIHVTGRCGGIGECYWGPSGWVPLLESEFEMKDSL